MPISVDRNAWIRAGTKLSEIGEPLQRMGLALANQGDIDRQSLAGAIATGTHGTGATLGGWRSGETDRGCIFPSFDKGKVSFHTRRLQNKLKER